MRTLTPEVAITDRQSTVNRALNAAFRDLTALLRQMPEPDAIERAVTRVRHLALLRGAITAVGRGAAEEAAYVEALEGLKP